MSLNYKKLAKSPTVFLRLTGLKPREFVEIVEKIRVSWDEIEKQKRQAGRTSHLPFLEDKLLALFTYYRTYITHEFLGYLFNLHNSNICRLFKKLEPVVAKKIIIKKDRSLTEAEILRIIADVTEQPIQRPKKSKKQKKSYSGKKKRHTIKTEIVMSETNKILSISKSHPGKKHDYRIRKEERVLPIAKETYVDSGYQGFQKVRLNVKLPIKRKRGISLTDDEKEYNRKIASFRIKVEHKIREIKIFKIASDVYRNFQKKHNLRMNIIAAVVNLKNGF